MKVLMISTDKKILDKNSAVACRMVEYGGLVEELHIVVFAKRKSEIRNPKPETPDITQAATGQANSKFKIQNSNVFVYPTNSKNRWFYIFDAIKIGKKMTNIDLVTTQDPFEAGFVGWRVARAYGARHHTSLQLQIHTDFLSQYFIKQSILNKIRAKIARFLLPKADSIRVVSERIKNSLINDKIIKDFTKITVLSIFTDIEKIKRTEPNIKIHEKYPQFDFIILMASRLSEEKNISLALSAFRKIKEKYPKTGLVIVGEGKERRALIQQATSNKQQANVIFEPWLNDLISYYKTADLFLNTSNYEGYGLTLIEAASSECPIVTTDVGVVCDVFNKNNVLICNVGDSDCIAGKIILAMENKAIRERLSKDALKAVSKISISKEDYLKEYNNIWKDVIE